MATPDEDFSFPATTTLPCVIDSPPLWRRSSAPRTFHDKKPDYTLKGKEVMGGDEFIDSCSFQELEASSAKRSSHDYYAEEEKMDALWEDLDEKFSRNSDKTAQKMDISSSPGKKVHMSCVNVRALKLSTENGHLPSILVFIKVLKKIFLLHNSRRTIEKRAW